MNAQTKLVIIVIAAALGLIGFEIIQSASVGHTALAGCERGPAFNNALQHSNGNCFNPH